MAVLTLSWRWSHLLCKSVNWLLYDRDLRHERVKNLLYSSEAYSELCYRCKMKHFTKIVQNNSSQMFGRVLNTPLLLFSRTIFPEEYQESSISSNKYINHTYDKEKQFYIVIKLEQKKWKKESRILSVLYHP